MTESTGNLPTAPKPASASVFQSSTFAEPASLQIWTSLDPTTPEGKAAIVGHMQGESAEAIGDALNTIVEVANILVHRVEIVDTNTGELLEADRIVMIRPDGSSVACVSAGIRRSLQLICNLYSLPPWNPAMRLKVQQKQTRAGRRTYNLVPVVDSKVAK